MPTRKRRSQIGRGTLLPIFNALAAQPDVAPVLAGGAVAAASAPIPVQTAAPAVTAAGVPTDVPAITQGTGAQAAPIDPRLFSLSWSGTRTPAAPTASPDGAQAASLPTDQIIGQRENRPLSLQAGATAQASAFAAAAGEEARPRASGSVVSALATGAEPDQDEAGLLAPLLPATGASPATSSLIADTPAAAAARGAAPAAERIDFAALVDAVARAREAGAGAQDVAASVTHTEFGKVSLRFQSEGNALAVSMMSPDPGFAPAVAAARLADAGFGQNAQATGQPNPSQSASSQSGLAGDGSSGARGGSAQRQDAQHQGRSQTSRSEAPRTNLATGDDLRRGTIWA